ncbi:hypothetical protein IY145_19265 [Methylosinus sp. H3A]|uniref:hypothetical protein n=1 Tax=Methylosinus sp. H3A TaxID=2785786 RepID=UPI0018C1E30B|nr:hypothetical protein [Methylosinus sp. H3A]MBG0811496.1 hypothetical protein [Methylosinus sp. H3A]
MIDEHHREFHGDESNSDASSQLTRRALLTGLFALPVAVLDAGSAEAQYIGFGPFRLHLGPTGGGYNGGYPYRTRRPPRQVVHHHGGGGGSRHASRRSRRGGNGGGGGNGGDTGGGANSSATGLGKADY